MHIKPNGQPLILCAVQRGLRQQDCSAEALARPQKELLAYGLAAGVEVAVLWQA